MKFLPLILLVGLVGCGGGSGPREGLSAGILGGKEIATGDPQLSFLAAVRLRASPGEVLCSASLISSKVLVTAAHCLYQQSHLLEARDLEVVFSISSRSSDPTGLRKVKSFAIHPQYVPSRAEDACAFGPCPPNDDFAEWLPNDLALVVLEEAAPADSHPLPLATTSAGFSFIAGYGYNVPLTEIGDDPSQSGRAKVLAVKVISRPELREKFHKIYIETTNTEGACFGDSGGPLFYEIRGFPFLMGVLSHSAHLENGFGCGQRESVYTDLPFHRPWIEIFLRGQK